MKFTKMHGAGNDFIIINNIEEKIPETEFSSLAKALCTQRMSIGADGMMVVVPAKNGGDYGMLFFNSDGSLGEMCGNGARCICRYGYENGLAGETQHVETTAGLVTGERIDSKNYRIRLNDASTVDIHRAVNINSQSYDCAYVELGCPGIPHAILELDFAAMDKAELRELGRALRFAPEFPKGANVSFVKVVANNIVDIITFERGVEDFTLACGTGCGSAAVALLRRGICGTELRLHAPGGDLRVSLNISGDEIKDIFLTGPTCMVCIGEVLDR
ncbi:MAG: diaminopimelate epimerase [Oscillospiraceae bacterium]|nr:diaminopimelate epimerase [Oscillospiraceae bacterium]